MAEIAAGEHGAERGHPLAEVAAAIAFLTRVPVAARSGGRSRTGAAAFGLVGAGLGLVAALPLAVAGLAHPVVAAIAAVAILAILDGALHLDGLADTFDALAAPAGGAERARTDPRTGTAGVVVIVAVLGLDAAALAELAANDGLRAAATLIAAATVSRAVAPVWAVTVGRRLRPIDGLGSWFADHVSVAAAAFAVVTAALVSIVLMEFAGPGVALAAVAGAGVGIVVGGLVVLLRGQLDGDGYGAIIEITFAAVLLVAVVLG